MYFLWVAILAGLYLLGTKDTLTKAATNSYFATSKFYEDVRVAAPFIVRRYFRRWMPEDVAVRACRRLCGADPNCLAINFFTYTDSYICDLLPDNYCISPVLRKLGNSPRCTVWDKIIDGPKASCVDRKLYGVAFADYCEVLRGCRGTWPRCDECPKHCIDCKLWYNVTGYSSCTVWVPVINETLTTPILVNCRDNETYLMSREINLSTGRVLVNQSLRLQDMHGLCRHQAYTYLRFAFYYDQNSSYEALYSSYYIHENGSLSLTFASSKDGAGGDGFRLNGASLLPASFVFVRSNVSSCGSFWLLDSSNTNDCPGGAVGIFGTPTINASGHVTDTGIHWPLATEQGKMLYKAEVTLYNP